MAQPWKEGDLVADRYRLVSPLGEGGMGEVWAARQQVSGREVALELIAVGPGDPDEAEARFRREVTAPARVDHPGVLEVIDAGRAGGWWFIATERLEGDTLRARLDGPQALDDVARALEPLAALHEAGLVHRDIKPENLFVTWEDGQVVVKLLDFGIATLSGDEGHHTSSGLGTPGYLAPEQALAPAQIGPPTDVWAMGVVIYEALTGRHPFEAETGEAMILRACTEPHRPILDVAPRAGAALSALVDRCLAKEPSARPRDAAALAAELREARQPPPAKRRAWLGLAFALVVGAAATVVWLIDREAGDQPPAPSSASEPSAAPPPSASPTSSPGPATWDVGLPPSAIPFAPVDEALVERTIEGAGWRFVLPHGWYPVEASPPHVLQRFAAPEIVDGYRPNVAVMSERWEGSFYEYAARMTNRDYEAGRMLPVARHQMEVDGHRGELIEAIFDQASPPYQMAALITVAQGRAVMMACSGPRRSFGEIREICQRILLSLRLGPS